MADPPAPRPEVLGAKGQTNVQEPTAAQRSIARRSAEARAIVPDLELRAEVDMACCLELRAAQRCSITAMLVRACALALRDVPRANGAYRDGRFELYSRVNVGVVVATEDAYVTPTVFDADRKPIAALSRELEELVAQARAGSLSSPAFSGATFTVSNPGICGIGDATTLITPPQAAALAAGAVREAALVRDGMIVAGQVMTITLVCDHRILYGAEAARFLGAVASRLTEAAL